MPSFLTIPLATTSFNPGTARKNRIMAYEAGDAANSNFSMVPFPVISPEIFHEHKKGSDWAGDGGIGLTEKKGE